MQASIQFPQPSQISLLRSTPPPFRFVNAPRGRLSCKEGLHTHDRQFEHKEFRFRPLSGCQFGCFSEIWCRTTSLRRPSCRSNSLCNVPGLRLLTFLPLLSHSGVPFIKNSSLSLYNVALKCHSIRAPNLLRF